MKPDRTITIIATVLMAGGIPVALIWISMLVIGGLVNIELPSYFPVLIIIGAFAALLGMVNGILITKNKTAARKIQTIFAAVTAGLSIPGGVMFVLMSWYFAAIPVFLFGFGPSAYYLLKIYDAHNDRKM